MGAGVLIPQRFFGASTRFFPKNFGLTPEGKSSAR